jgi:xanthine dehydrogenase YagS FAD-binding subunit
MGRAARTALELRDDQGYAQAPFFDSRRLSVPTSDLTYSRPDSLRDALDRLALAGARPLGGGTDLLPALEEDVEQASALVDLRRVRRLDGIEGDAKTGLRIGGATRLAAIAANATVRAHWPVLAQACEAVGTTALRHMGTIGGNLCQRPRCWYLRQGVSCLKNGGDSCPAEKGENRYHAILGGGPCYIVHPSDPAVALMALDAKVEIAGAAGTREVALDAFFTLPADGVARENVLAPGEIVAAIVLAPGSAGGWQRYEKVMARGAWDFALASLAAVRRTDGDVRLVLGGVAPRPWRVDHSVEQDVASGGIGPEDVATLADRALYDARPLSDNYYKVTLAAALLRRAMSDIPT